MGKKQQSFGNFDDKETLQKLKNLLKEYSKIELDNDSFENITPYNGFDQNDLNNARQNNYAWSMCEFNGYIYVGTGRNLPLMSYTMGKSAMKTAIDYAPQPGKLDMTAEIWRYKVDGSLPWQRVYKSKNIEITNPSTNQKQVVAEFIGFRSLLVYDSFEIKPAMYASAYSLQGVKILKSTNGVDWFDINSNITDGTSSRSLIKYDGKIYMAIINDGVQDSKESIIYYSEEPELQGWTKLDTDGIKGKNPTGPVWSMTEFNNRLYVGTASQEGFMIWRSNNKEPMKDDWTLVMDKGGGDAKNAIAITLKPYNEHLYVGTAYDVSDPMIYVVPKGAEIFRVDKEDDWDLVVGGVPVEPTLPTTGKRGYPLSGYMSGFDNEYNIYMWQMVEYNGKLYVGTYDSSVSVEPTLELFLKNKDMLESMMGKEKVELSIELLKSQIKILSKFKVLLGFDFYSTEDGVTFKPESIGGFGNRYNYGIRTMLISSDNEIYIGTANPFQGCEIYKYLDDYVYKYKYYYSDNEKIGRDDE